MRKGAIVDSAPLPELIGLKEIAELKGVPRGTADSWRSRGDLPEPDITLSGKPLWIKSRIMNPEAPTEPLPALVSTAEVAHLFGVKVTTVKEWKNRNIRPEPDVTISRQPVWRLETWLAWSAKTGRPIVHAYNTKP
jgi:hypothetical protein